MTVALHERGLFTWAEWAAALSAEVKKPDAAADGSDYYELLAARRSKSCSPPRASPRTARSTALADAWQRAAHATPHGQPILLENDPQSRGG